MTSTPVFTAHGVPDLLGALPTRFGFVPEESLCVIATSGPRHRFGFSMRLDLPETPDDVDLAVRTVTHHLHRQQAEGAIIIAVSSRPELAGPLVWATERALGPVRPVVSAWADGTRYWTTFEDCDPHGHPYDPGDHDLAVVHAVAEGQEILPSRAELVARYAPVTGERARWLAVVAGDVAVDVARLMSRQRVPDLAALAHAEALPLLRRCRTAERLTDEQTLRLGVWSSSVPVREVLLRDIDLDNARDSLRVWAHVGRTVPSPFRADPLCLAAYAAYLLGDGAQALVALEQALAADRHHVLAGVLLETLQAGVHPRDVERVVRAEVAAH